MRSVHCGDIQGRERLSAVLTVLSGQVLGRDRRDLRVDVQRLSLSHVLWCRQQSADSTVPATRDTRGPMEPQCEACERGGLQGRERLRCLHAVRRGKYSTATAAISEATCQELSFPHVLGSRERAADQLYLQQGVHRAGWCRSAGVYRGDVQGRERLVTVLTVLSGQVLDRDRRDTRVDVQRVSGIHVLTRRQLDADQLYLQQGIHGA